MYLFIRIYICLYSHTYIHIYRERERNFVYDITRTCMQLLNRTIRDPAFATLFLTLNGLDILMKQSYRYSFVYICMYICMYVYMDVCIYVCAYV
jgi:hypothetical protein